MRDKRRTTTIEISILNLDEIAHILAGVHLWRRSGYRNPATVLVSAILVYCFERSSSSSHLVLTVLQLRISDNRLPCLPSVYEDFRVELPEWLEEP